ncbi:DNA/RNA nuclease SfsA [Pinisolibacter sp.]|uniref:DNA/RNA nuclease SfsA n=1 Tax=Pinisolibacter sp. TaxID=2172024 RepID=UPI002FDCCB3C
MRFTTPLVPGRLVKRYKRFLADVVLESGEEITAHCANSGSMLSLARPGARVLLQKSDDPKRKLAWSWKLEEVEGHLVCIDTGHPNAIVAEAIAAGTIPSLTGYTGLRREVKYGKNSRIDILLEDEIRGRAYVEVKNVTLMREPGLAEFPDAVTSRGAKHLDELADMVAEGHRAVMVYLVNRPDCTRFALAADIDPAYAQGFAAARARGVEIEVWATRVSAEEVLVERRIAVG